MYAGGNPCSGIQLGADVGGIRGNRANPGRYCKPNVMSGGSPPRELLDGDDCADGIWLAAERYDGEAPVNLGTGEEIAIRDLAELIAELTGLDGEIVWDAPKPNGQPRRKLDVSRAEELFGFRAHTSLRDGLEQTVAWYRTSPLAAAAAP